MANPTKEQLKQKLKDEKEKSAALEAENSTLKQKIQKLNQGTVQSHPIPLHGGKVKELLED